MMTEAEVMGRALGTALYEATTFGKDECQKGMQVVSELVKRGECDDATADRCRAELGNHSAIRQWAIKQSIIEGTPVAEDARARETKTFMQKLETAKRAQLNEALEAGKQAPKK